MKRVRHAFPLMTVALAASVMIPATAVCGNETSLMNTVPGWYYRMPTGSTNIDMYFTVDATDEMNLYFGGIYMDGTSFETLAKSHGLAFSSQDGGARVNDIAGELKGTLADMCVMVDIDAVSPGLTPPKPTIWASCGTSIGLSADGGYFKKFDAPAAGEDNDQINCLHMFDGGHGVAGAESGAIYRFELSEDGESVTFTAGDIDNTPSTEHPSATPALVAMHWLSDSRGWAVAVESEVSTLDDGEGTETDLQFYYATRVFGTTDGGRNWNLLGTVDLPSEDPVHQVTWGSNSYPLSFEGGWLPREIRMVDDTTGFMALAAWDNTKSVSVVAKIMKTTDGGKTWTDLQANMQVGTLQSFMTQSIFFSEVAGTYFWKDSDGVVKGRVVGASFVTEGGSSGGGSPPKFFYLTMISTDDGGATWTKAPNLGDVSWDFSSGADPINTPRPFDAVFLNQYRGFAVGEKGTVFRFQYKCTQQPQCDFGYFCNPEEGADHLTCLSCEDIGLTSNERAIEHCATWTPPPEDEELTGRDAWEPADDTLVLVDAAGAQDLAGWNGDDPKGCHAGHYGHVASALVLLLLAAGAFLIARLRAHRRTTAPERHASSVNQNQ